MKIALRLTAWVLSFLVIACANAGPVQITLSPLYLGPTGAEMGMPLQATISNEGAPFHGVLRIESDSIRTEFPVAVGAGELKSLPLFLNQYLPRVTYTLEGRGVYESGTMQFAPSTAARRMLWVTGGREKTNAIGGPFSIKPKSKNAKPSKESVLVMQCRPKQLPDRPAGFQSFNAVLLGNQSAKLTDSQISALTDFALSGGNVILEKEAEVGAVNDPRWTRLIKSNPQQFGLGTIFPLELKAGNLTEKERSELMAQVPRRNGNRAWTFVNPLSPQDPSASMPAQSGAGNPFRIRLPSVGRIAGILFGFLIVVVPINLLILNRLRRPELAWFSTPLLSVGAAALLFSNSSTLYKAPLTNYVAGTVIAQENFDNAIVVGSSEIFFPHQAEYSLGLRNVDTVQSDDTVDRNIRFQNTTLDVVDNGNIQIPRFAARNMQFERFQFLQRTTSFPKIKFQVRPYRHLFTRLDFQDVKEILITNESDQDIHDATAICGPDVQDLGTLHAHETKNAIVRIRPSATSSVSSFNPYADIVTTYNQIALSGTMSRMDYGPALGANPSINRGRLIVIANRLGDQ